MEGEKDSGARLYFPVAKHLQEIKAEIPPRLSSSLSWGFCSWSAPCRSFIAQGVRDGLQQAVITVATTNYDETYRGLREGYSGGYRLSGEQWVEDLDYDDVYYRLDSLLGTERDGSYHVKVQDGGYEYRLSGLRVKITNTGLAPGSASRNFEADARITIEIPMSFGWGVVPSLTMELRTKAAYMPKF